MPCIPNPLPSNGNNKTWQKIECRAFQTHYQTGSWYEKRMPLVPCLARTYDDDDDDDNDDDDDDDDGGDDDVHDSNDESDGYN